MKTKTIITKAQCLIDILEKNGFKGFVDSTSQDEATESIFNKELELQIYLPNSKNYDFEAREWNKFSINEHFDFTLDLNQKLFDKWNPIFDFMTSIGCEWE